MHKLIGSLGAFGADQAIDFARALENLAADHAFAPAEKIISKLGDEVEMPQSRLNSIS